MIKTFVFNYSPFERIQVINACTHVTSANSVHLLKEETMSETESGIALRNSREEYSCLWILEAIHHS